MTAPFVTPDDLGRALNDANLNVDRASDMIADAYALCVAYCSPAAVPATAAVVVKRVAKRMYVDGLSSRRQQLADAGSQYGGGPEPDALSDTDRADLDRFMRAAAGESGTGGAFDIDLLPAGYALPVAPWDQTYTLPPGLPS